MKVSKLTFTMGSLFTLAVFGYFINQNLNKSIQLNSKMQETSFSSVENLNDNTQSSSQRKLASIKNTDSYKMTNSLADQLAKVEADHQTVKAKGQKLSNFDRLIFEELQSKYEVQFENGKIKALQFNQVGDSQPLKLQAEEDFLMDHKNVWSLEFDKTQTVDQQGQNQIKKIQLLDKNNKEVGFAEFTLNSKGEWESLKIQNN